MLDEQRRQQDAVAHESHLVAGLDGGCMRQNGDVRIKLPACHRAKRCIHQHHSLANLRPLDFFQRKCGCLSGNDLQERTSEATSWRIGKTVCMVGLRVEPAELACACSGRSSRPWPRRNHPQCPAQA